MDGNISLNDIARCLSGDFRYHPHNKYLPSPSKHISIRMSEHHECDDCSQLCLV